MTIVLLEHLARHVVSCRPEHPTRELSLGAPGSPARGGVADAFVLAADADDEEGRELTDELTHEEARAASTRLAYSLLHALGRLPEAPEMAVHQRLPAGLPECCHALTTAQGPASSPTALVELLLLHLQCFFKIGGGADGGGRAPRNDGPLSSSPSPVDASSEVVPAEHAAAALEALEAYLFAQAGRLHSLLPASTLRRIATIWVCQSAERLDVVDGACRMDVDDAGGARDGGAGHGLASALLQLPAEQSLALPAEVIGWMWRQRCLEDDVAALTVRWAVLQHGRPSSDGRADGCTEAAAAASGIPSRGGSLSGSPPRPTSLAAVLIASHRASEDGARLLVSLLSTRLHVTCARPGGAHAVLSLACSAVNGALGQSECSDGARAHFFVSLMSSGLACALGRLCLLLPTGDAHAEEHRLVLRLMTTQMLRCAPARRGEMHDGRPGSAVGTSAAEVAAALHHASAALLRDAHAPPPAAIAAGAELRLELINFANVAITLHDDALDVISGNAPLVLALAAWASHAALPPAAEPPAAASAVLLVHLLHRLAAGESLHRPAPSPSHASPRRQLLHKLHSVLPLDALLPGLRSRLGLRRAATLELAAELCGGCSPAPFGAAQQLCGPLPVGLGAGGCGLSASLLHALINASTCREPTVLAGLSHLATALVTHAPADLDRLSSHPWNGFALEIASLRSGAVGGFGACDSAYWSVLLERRPAWTHAFVTRKPALIQLLVCRHIIHATPLTLDHLRLLRALQSIEALGPKLVAEATKLLQLRAREPSAARWTSSRGGHTGFENPGRGEGSQGGEGRAGGVAGEGGEGEQGGEGDKGDKGSEGEGGGESEGGEGSAEAETGVRAVRGGLSGHQGLAVAGFFEEGGVIVPISLFQRRQPSTQPDGREGRPGDKHHAAAPVGSGGVPAPGVSAAQPGDGRGADHEQLFREAARVSLLHVTAG